MPLPMNKNKPLMLLHLFAAAVILASCASGEQRTTEATPLNRLNWSERNYAVLNEFILNYGTGGIHYDREKPPYAVFDWDQTCAHFDVEEAVMHYQLFNLRFSMTKEQFRGILKDTINGVTHITTGESHGGAPVAAGERSIPLAAINADLMNDYSFLYDRFAGMKGSLSLDRIKQTLQYQDFVARLPFLLDAYFNTPGIGDEYGLCWILWLFTGQTVGEVKALAREAIDFELGNRIAKVTLHSPGGLSTLSGEVSHTYRSGLRVFPEMQDLIATMQRHGIGVFIVSASYKPVVEVFGGDGYGYNLDPGQIVAMELELDPQGRILPEYRKGWVKTYREGKVAAIRDRIGNGLGRDWDPVFSAGDSDGDYAMSTAFEGMKLSLIWNRVRGGDIGKLCRQAVEQMGHPYPRYILQGRNENTGMVRPAAESILLGQTNPRLLP